MYITIREPDARLILRAINEGLERAHNTDNGTLLMPQLDATIGQSSSLSVKEPVRRHSGSGFKFGSKSQRELEGVHPILVDVATLALDFSTQDFMIFDGLRTQDEQRNHVRRGNSKTMHSKHLPQSDGMSHAVDAVPVVGTIPKWEWPLIYPVVMAFDKAATELGHADKIVWGGAWDRRLSDFGGNRAEPYHRVVEDYAARNPGKDFLDGPHFELRL